MSRLIGFRFHPTDAIVLAAGALATWWLLPRVGTYAWLCVVAIGHFFLFCNVFRVRRSYELGWAAIFVVNFAAWGLSGAFSWLGLLATQTPVTIAFVVAEMRGPHYRGIGARRGPPVD